MADVDNMLMKTCFLGLALLSAPLACDGGDDGGSSETDATTDDSATGASTGAASTGESTGGTTVGSASASTSGGTTNPSTTGASETSTTAPTTATTDATTGDPTNPTSPTTTGGVGDDHAQLCVDIINMYRATIDLPPYARWSSAEACTDSQCEMDAGTNTPHGAFGICDEWAQNECPGWSGNEDDIPDVLTGCLAQMWAEGPGDDFQQHGHYINMSSESYTQVACGFYITPGNEIWAIQNFQ